MAVLGQVFNDVCVNDLAVIKRHLRGLYLIYKHLKKTNKLTPITRFMARITGRTDVTTAYYFGDELIWPPFTPLDEVEDRKWMTSRTGFSRNLRPRDIDLALANFEIDNIWNQTYTFARQSHILRQTDPNAEEKIHIHFQILQQSFQCWKQRNVIVECKEIEILTRLLTRPASDPFTQFLHYDSLSIQDRFYAKLLNQWRAAYIFTIRVIPFPNEYIQQLYAIEICQTTAALEYDAFSSTQWECLFHVGIVLGQAEREWIVNCCRMIASRLPILSSFVEKFYQVWSEEQRHWNIVGKLYPRQEDVRFK